MNAETKRKFRLVIDCLCPEPDWEDILKDCYNRLGEELQVWAGLVRGGATVYPCDSFKLHFARK